MRRAGHFQERLLRYARNSKQKGSSAHNGWPGLHQYPFSGFSFNGDRVRNNKKNSNIPILAF
jgi:hypothetical protein